MNILHERLQQANKNGLLDLSNYHLSETHLSFLNQTIKKNSKITKVSAKNCGLTNSPAFIKKLSNLKVLDLSTNRIKTISDKWEKYTKLIVINLSDNPVSEIPDISKCISLRILILNNTCIRYIPETWVWSGLKMLEMSNHKLIDAEKDILNLPVSLEHLVLSNGHFKTGKLRIGHMVNIETLDASGNEIYEVADDLINGKHLIELNLSNNKLTNLPSNIGELALLKRLNCSNNNISKVPKQLLKCENLEYLSFLRKRN